MGDWRIKSESPRLKGACLGQGLGWVISEPSQGVAVKRGKGLQVGRLAQERGVLLEANQGRGSCWKEQIRKKVYRGAGAEAHPEGE